MTDGQLDLVTSAELGVRDRAVSKSTARRLFESVPPNTRRAYGRAWDGRRDPDVPLDPPGGFVGWCAQQDRTPMPATPETLAEYVSHLCDLDRSPATIEQIIAAIRTRHRLAGYGRNYPDAENANRVLRSHRRDRAAHGKGGQKQATPIVIKNLRKMVETIDTETLIGARDHALLVLGLALFGRRSELAALEWDDIAGHSEGMTVAIRMSKTDQEARGEQVPVLWGTFPGTNPVVVLDRWREAVASRGQAHGPVLRQVTRSGKLSGPLPTNAINRIVRRRAYLAGLLDYDPDKYEADLRAKKVDARPAGRGEYSAHSLRAGAATVAYMNGAPIDTICRLGRWKKGSRVVLGYIRSVDQWKDHPFRGVL